MSEVPFAWLNTVPIPAIGAILLAGTIAAAAIGAWVRARQTPADDPQEGYVVQSLLGVLALLMGFTFSLAIERFETRRELVVQQANAIGTAYLRVQLLDQPHRARLSGLLIAYTDNLVILAELPPTADRARLAADDRLLTEIWSATAAAFDAERTLPFTTSLLEAINAVIDMDASRRAGRLAHVPPPVFAILLSYVIATAGVLGYVAWRGRARLATAFLLLLLNLSFLLIIDIDRATTGRITESQQPMRALAAALHAQPPAVFDRWRGR